MSLAGYGRGVNPLMAPANPNQYNNFSGGPSAQTTYAPGTGGLPQQPPATGSLNPFDWGIIGSGGSPAPSQPSPTAIGPGMFGGPQPTGYGPNGPIWPQGPGAAPGSATPGAPSATAGSPAPSSVGDVAVPVGQDGAASAGGQAGANEQGGFGLPPGSPDSSSGEGVGGYNGGQPGLGGSTPNASGAPTPTGSPPTDPSSLYNWTLNGGPGAPAGGPGAAPGGATSGAVGAPAGGSTGMPPWGGLGPTDANGTYKPPTTVGLPGYPGGPSYGPSGVNAGGTPGIPPGTNPPAGGSAGGAPMGGVPGNPPGMNPGRNTNQPGMSGYTGANFTVDPLTGPPPMGYGGAIPLSGGGSSPMMGGGIGGYGMGGGFGGGMGGFPSMPNFGAIGAGGGGAGGGSAPGGTGGSSGQTGFNAPPPPDFGSGANPPAGGSGGKFDANGNPSPSGLYDASGNLTGTGATPYVPGTVGAAGNGTYTGAANGTDANGNPTLNGVPVSQSGSSAGSAAGGAAAPGGLTGSLSQSYQDAMNSANSANSQLAGSLMSGYDQRTKQALGLLGSVTGQQYTNLANQRDQQKSAATQNLTARGLGNTTVAPVVAAGIDQQYNQQFNNLQDQRIQDAVGMQTGLEGDQLNALSSFNINAPNYATLAALAQGVGASGQNPGAAAGSSAPGGAAPAGGASVANYGAMPAGGSSAGGGATGGSASTGGNTPFQVPQMDFSGAGGALQGLTQPGYAGSPTNFFGLPSSSGAAEQPASKQVGGQIPMSVGTAGGGVGRISPAPMPSQSGSSGQWKNTAGSPLSQFATAPSPYAGSAGASLASYGTGAAAQPPAGGSGSPIRTDYGFHTSGQAAADSNYGASAADVAAGSAKNLADSQDPFGSMQAFLQQQNNSAVAVGNGQMSTDLGPDGIPLWQQWGWSSPGSGANLK